MGGFGVKVSPHDATLLHETRDSVSMEHCSTLFQGVASVSNNLRYLRLRELGEHRQLPSRCRRGMVWEQCSMKQSCIVWIDLNPLPPEFFFSSFFGT